MRLCFILSCAVLFPLAVHAGDAAVRPQRITSVVRPDYHTGKLVRSVVVTSKPVASRTVPETVVAPHVVAPVETAAEPPAAPAANIDEAVERIAERNELPPQLIHSVIKVESNYNPFAVSSKGALGMMQLIPSTARRFGVSDVFNPLENIEGGARYLKYLLDLFNGNMTLAVAAYNAGENAVAKYGAVPPYPETRNYVRSVASQLQKRKVAAKPKQQETRPVETHDNVRHIQQVVEPDGSVRYVTR